MSFRNCCAVFMMLMAFGTAHVFAQHDSLRQTVGETISGDACTVLRDAGQIFSAPARFSSSEWIVAGAILGGTAVLFSADGSARTLTRRNQSSFGDDVFGFGREYGRPVYSIALSAGLYAAGLVFDDKDVRLTGVLIVESLAFSGVITNVLKSAAGRSRPFLEEGNLRFRGFQFKDGTTSFPSGHATVAFAVSSVLAERLHNSYVTIGLYAMATLTAVSRVYHDEHWVSDSFLGSAIGTVVGLSVCRLHEDKGHDTSLRFEPSLNGLRVELVY